MTTNTGGPSASEFTISHDGDQWGTREEDHELHDRALPSGSVTDALDNDWTLSSTSDASKRVIVGISPRTRRGFDVQTYGEPARVEG